MPRLRTLIPTLFASIALLAAQGCSPAASEVPAFDQNRAFDLLKKQVEIGPRYPGVPGHDAMVAFMQEHLKPCADSVEVHEFVWVNKGKQLKLHNVVAKFNPNAKKWVLLAAHWDSRPTADEEITLSKQKMPIPGANDGASGVAVLLEMARMFSQKKPDVGIYMILFDGEDYGPGENAMYLGSKYFAANLDKYAVVNGKRIHFEYGILLDMIGDKNLNIHYERNSYAAAPDVVKKVWTTAARLGHSDVFIPTLKYSINDDHIPLIEAGIKCIDVIDFDYAHWHTLDDTVDKCSPKSLGIVGKVISHVVYQESGS